MAGQPTLNVSAHHYRTAELAAARHTHELHPVAETIVNLDYAQSSAGNGSLGPQTLPPYLLQPAPLAFTAPRPAPGHRALRPAAPPRRPIKNTYQT